MSQAIDIIKFFNLDFFDRISNLNQTTTEIFKSYDNMVELHITNLNYTLFIKSWN